MTELELFAQEKKLNLKEQGIDVAALLGAVPPSIRDAQTGIKNYDSSLPAMALQNFARVGVQSPYTAVAITAGVEIGGVVALRFLPGTSTHLLGSYGAAKLALTDARDLISSKSAADYTKYGLASASDLLMVQGLISRYVPGYKQSAILYAAVGGLGRLTAELLPESNRQKPKERYYTAAPESESLEIKVATKAGKEETREFDVYVPPNKVEALPVVLLLHGVQDAGAPGMELESKMNRIAAEKGFIAVYPLAKEKKQAILGKVYDWNSPGTGITSENPDYDDVDYIKGVIAKVKQTAKVDERAIYAIGFSSGGSFAQHLRGRLPGTFAGVGSIHGTFLGTEAKARDNSAFVSVHSDSDHMLPYNGGRGLMTSILPRVASSEPRRQVEEAAKMNGIWTSSPKIGNSQNIQITDYTKTGTPPVREYYIQGGIRGGIIGGILGRGRDGFPASHAIDGIGAGGWPLVGDKNRSLDTTRLVLNDLLSYRR